MRYTISLSAATCLAFAAGGALAEAPRVVTDIPPVHSLVAQVMAGVGEPVLLLDTGANAHDYQLKPSQAAALAEADLVVWIGPEMTPWLERALDSAEGAARLGLLATPGTELQSYAEAGAHDHAEEAGHDDHAEGEEAGHDEHDHSGTDPHAWLDPVNARLWLGVIAAELARIDPANAAGYAANAEAAATRIAAVDASVKSRLEPVHGIPFVVFHDAYGYFADHYGLTIAGAIAMGDAASPGAAHLKSLQAKMQGGQPICIFPEANHDPKLVATMVEGSGARVGAPLDPEGSLLDPGPELYDALLAGLGETIAECLSGG